MSTDPRYIASNEASVLARLAKAMGVVQNFGSAEDARRESPPRITWVWKSERYVRDPAQQREEMAVAHEVEPLFDVHVWGRDYLEASSLRARLLAALFNELSTNAYETAGEGKPPREDESRPAEGVGLEIVVPIRLLKVPVPFRVHTSVTLSSATARGTVTGPIGGTPTSDAGTIVASST